MIAGVENPSSLSSKSVAKQKNAKRKVFAAALSMASIAGALAIMGSSTNEKARSLSTSRRLQSSPSPSSSICSSQIIKNGKSDSTYFGASVAASNDYVVVGAWDEEGAAYVYEKESDIGSDRWNQVAKLTATSSDDDITPPAFFGRSVAINKAGDIIVVGADSWWTTKPGAAYVFRRTGSSWTQEAKLIGDDSTEDRFGAAVAMDGNTIVVGAPGDSTNSDSRGAVYVFTYNGSKWERSSKLNAPPTAGEFGDAVAISGNRIVVGDNLDERKGINAGAVHVFSQSFNKWTKDRSLYPSDAAAEDYFGSSVALDGDTIAVGADGADTLDGAVYVFDRKSSGAWRQTDKLSVDVEEDCIYFGQSIALQNNVLAVGTYSSNKAYVFDRSGATWVEKEKLTDPNGSLRFGLAVAVDGSNVVVGDAVSASESGSGPTIFELCS